MRQFRKGSGGNLAHACRGFVSFVPLVRSLPTGMSLLLLLLLTLEARANDKMVLRDALQVGTQPFNYGTGVAVDGYGNVFLAGFFWNSMDLDPGTTEDIVISAGEEDIFVCKLGPAGEYLWGHSFGGTGKDRATSIALDAAGDLIVAGYIEDTVIIGVGPDSVELTSVGQTDIFIAKLATTGVLAWAASMGGTYPDSAMSIAVDSAGSIWSIGDFGYTADFDPGPDTYDLVATNSAGVFVCGLTSSGGFIRADYVGSGLGPTNCAITVDGADNLLFTGAYRSFVYTGTEPVDPNRRRIAVTKADRAGNVYWSKSLDLLRIGSATSNGIAVDAAGNVYVTGYFYGMMDIDPGPDMQVHTSEGFDDIFLCKLDASGEFQWGNTMGSDRGGDVGTAVALDSAGFVYITGHFRDNVDFDPGPETFELVSVNWSNYDVFVCKFDAGGDFVWAGSAGADDGWDEGFAIDVDSEGRVFCTGYGVPEDFDPGAGVYALLEDGGPVFLWVLEPQSVPVAVGDMGETPADQMLTQLLPTGNSLLANDSDSNARAQLLVSSFDDTSVLGARVQVNADGTFVYDPTVASTLRSLAPGEVRMDSFTYAVTDGTDDVIGTVTITVYGSSVRLPVLALWGLAIVCVVIAGHGTRRIASS